MTQLICPKEFTNAVSKLRSFFMDRGFLEVHTQNRLSILAACEDPGTVSSFDYAGNVYPLPQTGQMWLEHELLTKPVDTGYFCVSTSYRQEPNPIPGRHDLIFPMFEFEMPGDVKDLEKMERDLCEHLGFGQVTSASYQEWCEDYGVEVLEDEHEERMCQEHGAACMITRFPNHTSPFWNMKQNGDGTAAKIDVIIKGQETIGSAERSTSTEEMRDMFHTISDGEYANLLYSKFGKDRVEKELEDFLAYDFFPRVGGGIGMTRMIRALREEN